MTKRTDGQFERRERDFYPTPATAVRPLVYHLPYDSVVYEPCCGDGALINSLRGLGYNVPFGCDIMYGFDALNLTREHLGNATHFVTNPPWRRDIMHPLLMHLSDLLPTWLLFDADWKHTEQAIPYMNRCRRIVSVGRVKWIPGSKYQGFDNCAWYEFTRPIENSPPLFYGRKPRK